MPNLATVLHEAEIILDCLESTADFKNLEINGVDISTIVDILKDLKNRCKNATYL